MTAYEKLMADLGDLLDLDRVSDETYQIIKGVIRHAEDIKKAVLADVLVMYKKSPCLCRRCFREAINKLDK